MADSGTSFTVEVLGFPREADPKEIASKIAEFFGIQLEEAQRLVRKAPIRVKRGAPSRVAQQLVKQLRKLGADVLVRNEQTGEERTFRAGDGATSRPPAQGPQVIDELDSEPPAEDPNAPPEETLESEEDASPIGSRPQVAVEVVVPSVRDRAAMADLLAASEPLSQRAFRKASASMRSARSSSPGTGERRSSSPSLPGQSDSQPAPSVPQSGKNSLSLPPPSRSSVALCTSCKTAVERGEVCARCGWSNSKKVRHCRQCKKELSVVSLVTKSPVVLGAIVVGSLALSIVALLFAGAPFAGAALAIGMGAGLATDAFTLRQTCKSCTIAVVSGRLLPEEEARIASARRRSLGVAIACAALAGLLSLVPSGSGQTLSASSYGMAWTVKVPRTHGRIASEVVMIKVPVGERRLRLQSAEKTFLAGSAYHLANLQYTYPAGKAELDKPGLEATLTQLITGVFKGIIKGPIQSKGESLEAEFTGSFHGKPVFGRVRGTQYEHDMVLVAVTSGEYGVIASSDTTEYLASVNIVRDAK